MSGFPQERSRRGFSKPTHSRSRETYGSYQGGRSGDSRPGGRRENTPPPPPPPPSAPKADFNDGPPAWLDSYLENFKKQLITDITKDILKTLDVTFQNDAERRRFKSSYFALKNRIARMEAQPNAEESREQPNPQVPPVNNDKKQFERPNRQRNGRNGNGKRFPEPTASSSHDVKQHDNHAVLNGKKQYTTENDKKAQAVQDTSKKTRINVDYREKDVIVEPKTELIEFPSDSPRNDTDTFPTDIKEEANKEIDVEAGRSSEAEDHKNSSGSPSSFKSCSEKISMSPGVFSSLTEILNLLDKDNAVLEISSTDEESKILCRKVRSILNKLTSENFDLLHSQAKELKIDTSERQKDVINVFFESSMDEPVYAAVYARLCKQMALDNDCLATFRELLLSRGEAELVQHKEKQTVRAAKLSEFAECLDKAEASKLQTELEQGNPFEFMGTITFMGELYNQDLLADDFMEKCLQCLLRKETETELEYLCHLVKTIGKTFELHGKSLAPYFNQMEELRLADEISNKMKFMIKSLVDLMANGWEIKQQQQQLISSENDLEERDDDDQSFFSL